MSAPKVSVIVTVFRRTDFLRQALQSALDQTYDDLEIIVTDDSCSVAIRSIAASFGSDKIRYRTQTPTLGVALNLRAAVEEARGEYIAVLNDDDVWEPDFLEKLVPPLEADRQRVLAFSDHWLVDVAGEIMVARTDSNSRTFGRADLAGGHVVDLPALVIDRNGVPLAMAAVFRADAIDWRRVVHEVGGAYDYWISFLLAASGGKAWYVAERLTRYRIHAAMETARRAPDKSEHLVYIYRTLIEFNAFPRHVAVLRQRLAEAFYVVGKDNFMFDESRTARGCFKRSLGLAFTPRTLAFLCLSCCPGAVRSKAIARLQPATISKR